MYNIEVVIKRIYKRFRSALLGDILVSAQELHDVQLVTLSQQLKSNALRDMFYFPGRYVHKSYGHRPSPKTIMQLFNRRQ